MRPTATSGRVAAVETNVFQLGTSRDADFQRPTEQTCPTAAAPSSIVAAAAVTREPQRERKREREKRERKTTESTKCAHSGQRLHKWRRGQRNSNSHSGLNLTAAHSHNYRQNNICRAAQFCLANIFALLLDYLLIY